MRIFVLFITPNARTDIPTQTKQERERGRETEREKEKEKENNMPRQIKVNKLKKYNEKRKERWIKVQLKKVMDIVV